MPTGEKILFINWQTHSIMSLFSIYYLVYTIYIILFIYYTLFSITILSKEGIDVC